MGGVYFKNFKPPLDANLWGVIKEISHITFDIYKRTHTLYIFLYPHSSPPLGPKFWLNSGHIFKFMIHNTFGQGIIPNIQQIVDYIDN